jgi:CheY-like chemotaxis protein
MHHPFQVLVVEDTASAQFCCKMALGMLEHVEVSIAESGEDAIMQVLEQDFDVILMDIGLPKMDGLATAQKIRQLNSHKKDTTIIALTAHEEDSIKDQCFEAGMNDFLCKPFTFDKARYVADNYLALLA